MHTINSPLSTLKDKPRQLHPANVRFFSPKGRPADAISIRVPKREAAEGFQVGHTAGAASDPDRGSALRRTNENQGGGRSYLR